MKSDRQFHEEFRRDEQPAGGSDRGFGLVFAGFFAIVAAINFWREHAQWPWLLLAAAAFLVLAIIYPFALNPFNRIWTRFGLLLHRVTQPLIMGLLFFGTIVPMGALFRMMGKDFLRSRLEPSAASYWIVRDPPGPDPKSFRNQF